MATKTELIDGIQMLINESRRIGARFTDDEWAMAADEAGWTNKQVLAHVAAIGGIVVPMVGGMASAPAGTDLGANVNIDAMNAQLVGQRADKSIAALVSELETSYGGVIGYLRAAPDELLERRVTIGGFRDMPVGDLLMQMVVMHGIAHIYHAASRI
ncbi:MAG: DinB family protein [Chloroflexota bacterium]|nr:DinB family protein [Chloroflexota bacterium]